MHRKQTSKKNFLQYGGYAEFQVTDIDCDVIAGSLSSDYNRNFELSDMKDRGHILISVGQRNAGVVWPRRSGEGRDIENIAYEVKILSIARMLFNYFKAQGYALIGEEKKAKADDEVGPYANVGVSYELKPPEGKTPEQIYDDMDEACKAARRGYIPSSKKPGRGS